MSNGLCDHKHLGFNWRCAVAAFATLAAISRADWTAEDLTYILDAIDDVATEVSEVATELRSINYDHSDIVSGIEDANSELDTISSYLNSLNSKLSDLPSSHIFDEILWGIESIEFDIEKREKRQTRFEEAATNQLNNVASNTEATVDRLDLLLDYFTNQTFAAVFPTNYPASQISRYWNTDYIETELQEFYHTLYGRYPTEVEYNSFYDAYFFGNGNRFFDQVYSRLGYPEYLLDLYSSAGTGANLDDVYWDSYLVDDHVADLGAIYYAEYNTYDVTQYAASIMGVLTNGFDHLPGLVQSYDDDGKRVTTLDQDSSAAVGDLADSFTSTFGLESEVDEPNTNQIENLEDHGYSEALSGISRDTVIQDITVDLSSSLSALMQESQSYLIPTASADSFILDFGTMSIFGSSGQPVQFTLTRPPEMYFRIIRIVTAVLKIVVALGALYAIFHRVTSLDMS